MSLKVILSGASGRMGCALSSLAEECGAEVVGIIDVDAPAANAPWNEAQVVIDFSFHGATSELLKHALTHQVPVVIGTTGHTDEEVKEIRKVSGELPLTLAGNYSVGVNLLQYLTRIAARTLPHEYVPEVLELHHRHKKDAPSGTALNLAEAVEEERDFPHSARILGRAGETGERPNTQLAIHAIRGGEIIGEHTVYFIADSDRIELTHRAADRGIFARGAYRAAHWLVKKDPGLYSMQDVLELKD